MEHRDKMFTHGEEESIYRLQQKYSQRCPTTRTSEVQSTGKFAPVKAFTLLVKSSLIMAILDRAKWDSNLHHWSLCLSEEVHLSQSAGAIKPKCYFGYSALQWEGFWGRTGQQDPSKLPFFQGEREHSLTVRNSCIQQPFHLLHSNQRAQIKAFFLLVDSGEWQVNKWTK